MYVFDFLKSFKNYIAMYKKVLKQQIKFKKLVRKNCVNIPCHNFYATNKNFFSLFILGELKD